MSAYSLRQGGLGTLDYRKRVVHTHLARSDVTVVNLGLVDSPSRAHEAGHGFRAADVDLIFLHVTTYALSSTVLPVAQRAKVPIIVLYLQSGTVNVRLHSLDLHDLKVPHQAVRQLVVS